MALRQLHSAWVQSYSPGMFVCFFFFFFFFEESYSPGIITIEIIAKILKADPFVFFQVANQIKQYQI